MLHFAKKKWANPHEAKEEAANVIEEKDNISVKWIKSKYHILKAGGHRFLSYLNGTSEPLTEKKRNREEKHSQQSIHRCTLKFKRTLKEAELRSMSVNYVKGVMWTEYEWCGARLFLGSTYWPPLRSKVGDRIKRNNTLPDYKVRIDELIKTMDVLDTMGYVILTGDLNARFGDAFTDNTEDTNPNSTGRA